MSVRRGQVISFIIGLSVGLLSIVFFIPPPQVATYYANMLMTSLSFGAMFWAMAKVIDVVVKIETMEAGD